MELTASVRLSSDRLEHPAEWSLTVEVRNPQAIAVRLSTATLPGAVAFEVLDAAGAAVLLGPPPLPPADLRPGIVTIAPGDSLELPYTGNELFTDPPPAGSYRLRFAGHAPAVDGSWEGWLLSPWVDFEVSDRA